MVSFCLCNSHCFRARNKKPSGASFDHVTIFIYILYYFGGRDRLVCVCVFLFSVPKHPTHNPLNTYGILYCSRAFPLCVRALSAVARHVTQFRGLIVLHAGGGILQNPAASKTGNSSRTRPGRLPSSMLRNCCEPEQRRQSINRSQ